MIDHSQKKVEELKKVLEGKKKDHGPGTMDQGPEKETQEKTPPELKALQEKLNAVEEEAKQNFDKLLRVMADFENYKKRAAKDQEERVQYSLANLVKELLPVLDDFHRVLDHLPKETSPEIQSLTEGIHLIHRHFMTAMKKLGLHEVKTDGEKFDPHLHEALAQVESESVEEGFIVNCHRKGYQLHQRLVRPALVTIAKAKEPPKNTPNENQQ